VTSTSQPRGDVLEPLGGCGVEGRSDEEHCITCGDVAEPLRVVSIDRERTLALCERSDGARETVEIALVGEVAEGDELLVHAATAIAHLGRTPEEVAG
jgi:hydrogenase maturation factor